MILLLFLSQRSGSKLCLAMHVPYHAVDDMSLITCSFLKNLALFDCPACLVCSRQTNKAFDGHHDAASNDGYKGAAYRRASSSFTPITTMATNRFSTPAFQSRLSSLTDVRDQLRIVLERWCRLYNVDYRYDDEGNFIHDWPGPPLEIQNDLHLAANARGRVDAPLDADTLNLHMLQLRELTTQMNRAIELLQDASHDNGSDRHDDQHVGTAEHVEPGERDKPETATGNNPHYTSQSIEHRLLDCHEDEVRGIAEQLSDEELTMQIAMWRSVPDLAEARDRDPNNTIKLTDDDRFRLGNIDIRLQYLNAAYARKTGGNPSGWESQDEDEGKA